MTHLLDSNFLVDLLNADKKALKKIEMLEIIGAIPCTTSLNIHEVLKGIRKHSPANVERVLSFIRSLEVFSYKKEDAELSGKISNDLISLGKELDDFDVMIASIALNNKKIIITNNKKHFERIPGLKIEGY